LDSVEIIDLSSTETDCQPLQKFPFVNYGSVGEVGMDNKPIICGGFYNTSSCHTYSDGQWVEGPALNIGKKEASMVKTDLGIIISGGLDERGDLISSQDMLTPSGWKEIISLPKPVRSHCLITLNATHIMSIGGHNGITSLSEVNILDIVNEKWTVGPILNTPRWDHSCGKIKTDEGLDTVIVVGGYDAENDVEVLKSGGNEWISGPSLPKNIAEAQLVQDITGGVILIGGLTFLNAQDSLYRLSSLDDTWELMPQKLKIGRREHTAFLIDDDLTSCAKKQ